MKALQQVLGRNSDVAMVLAVLGVLMVLFVPIPRGLLDFLILANFAFAFLVLLLTFYYSKRFHDEVEFGDYLQYASLGMLEALERYDPARGVQFRTFAARRMHGAILDGLERQTEKQQQIAARQRLRQERVHEAKVLAGADASGVATNDPERLARFVADLGVGLALCWLLEGTGMVDGGAASTEAPFYRSVALRQLRDRLLHAVEHLPPPERTVVRGHYLQDLPFEQIAEMLQLTRGRISQIHKQALLRLRALMREDADWDASL